MKTAGHKANVKILLADDEGFIREIIVNALSTGGYREVQSAAKLSALEDVVASSYPDLLIINGEMADGDAVDVVRRIRLFRLGRNPFVPIIMTSWHSDGTFIRKVVDSGVDVLVTKPLAAGQLFARIDFLINARPPFVATARYLGPDRRKSKRDDDFPQFDVPNTLKERIGGEVFQSADLRSRILKVFSRMKIQRKHMQEKEIGRLGAILSKAAHERRSFEDIRAALGTMASSAALYAQELAPATSGEIAASAKALAETLVTIASDSTEVSEQQCSQVCDHIVNMGIEVPFDPDPRLPIDAECDNVQV